MPDITLNMDALAHNLTLIENLERRWNFRFLPVLKMVASHPFVRSFLHDRGHVSYGAADVDEHLTHGEKEPIGEDRVLITIPPLNRAHDVIRLFGRSAFSQAEGFHAVDAAARQAGCRHGALLMIDLGDMREGVPAARALPLLQQLAPASARSRQGTGACIAGLCVNLGCLYGTCPDENSMARLEDLVAKAHEVLGHTLETVSLGGTIFWNWFAERAEQGKAALRLPPGCSLEFRMGDPLLLGYDMYRDIPLLGGAFRRDVFRIWATVLEVYERDIWPPQNSVHNGQGLSVVPAHTGKRRRALLDCGRLHTDTDGLSLPLPGAEVVDFSGNYAVIDITDCRRPPAPGDRVAFLPSYWAVARAFRSSQVLKKIIHDADASDML